MTSQIAADWGREDSPLLIAAGRQPDELVAEVRRNEAVLAETWRPVAEAFAAVVRLRDEQADTAAVEESLVEYGRTRLALFKIPQLWFFVSEFPMTASGKIPKFVLRESIVKGELVP